MLSRRALIAAAPVVWAQNTKGPRILRLDLRSGGPYQFPPEGKAYRENGASHRAWRSILLEAPDAVVVSGDAAGLAAALQPYRVAVAAAAPASLPKSALREDQEKRLARTPSGVLQQLSGQYGQELRELVYTLDFSVWGRLLAGQTNAVAALLEPFLSGKVDSLAKPTASHYSGHLPVAAFFEKTGDKRALDRVAAAAALARKQPMHNEMSDSVFMVTPLLAKAGALLNEAGYFDEAMAHFTTMEKLCKRADGIYRHSPLDEAAWGRGNGFALLGLALTLSDFPKAHTGHEPLLRAYRALAERLAAWQTATGEWRQVIDNSEAWKEFTCTSMIGWALRRGLTRKWIRGAKYERAVAGAWRAIQKRTGLDGVLMDVCESTGKQKSLADYMNREAIFAKDPRGGSMAMLFAAELAATA